MKKIEAIVREEKFAEVHEALEAGGYPGMTVTHVEGHGRQRGRVEQFRGCEYKIDLLPKVKIEIIVKDGDAAKIVDLIRQAALTGEVGDGKIFVLPVETAIRVRTGESGERAI
ncbi:MAG: P-II family nitrogen regulator [Clostridia bacterium]|nr:P-II family nitrogen regulator [Clostridia bacterium]